MLRINLAAGECHPRVYLHDGAAHIVTPVFKANDNGMVTWAKITVRTAKYSKPYYNLRKAIDVVLNKEN